MVKITAILRPHQLEEVKTAVAAAGVHGMTVSDVRGSGDTPDSGSIGLLRLPIRAKLETVLSEEMVEEVVAAIIAAARTGEKDDGKIFIEDMTDAMRIRTEERGPDAI